MAIITKTEAKLYLRIDTDADDNLIDLQISVAEETLKNATGKVFDENNPIAKAYCLLLVQHLYEERSYTAPTNAAIDNVTSGLLLQLKYSYSDEEVTT